MHNTVSRFPKHCENIVQSCCCTATSCLYQQSISLSTVECFFEHKIASRPPSNGGFIRQSWSAKLLFACSWKHPKFEERDLSHSYKAMSLSQSKIQLPCCLIEKDRWLDSAKLAFLLYRLPVANLAGGCIIKHSPSSSLAILDKGMVMQAIVAHHGLQRVQKPIFATTGENFCYIYNLHSNLHQPNIVLSQWL